MLNMAKKIGVQMAQILKALARRLGSEFDPPWIKARFFLIQ